MIRLSPHLPLCDLPIASTHTDYLLMHLLRSLSFQIVKPRPHSWKVHCFSSHAEENSPSRLFISRNSKCFLMSRLFLKRLATSPLLFALDLCFQRQLPLSIYVKGEAPQIKAGVCGQLLPSRILGRITLDPHRYLSSACDYPP